jgi:hypothetical protein
MDLLLMSRQCRGLAAPRAATERTDEGPGNVAIVLPKVPCRTGAGDLKVMSAVIGTEPDLSGVITAQAGRRVVRVACANPENILKFGVSRAAILPLIE